MTSQTDLDQGGTFRQWQRAYLGPSVGWVNAPLQTPLLILSPGTYTVDPSTNYVSVGVAGAVTIILPSSNQPAAGPQALPGLFLSTPVLIFDGLGVASAHPITIQPHVGETVLGLPSITISTNYGGYTLVPAGGNWVSISP
jgi:hypothetical protein